MRHVKVTAFPSAKKDAVVEEKPEVFRVFTREEAQGNRANKAIVRLLSAHLQVPLGKVKIVSGHRKSAKLIEIHD